MIDAKKGMQHCFCFVLVLLRSRARASDLAVYHRPVNPSFVAYRDPSARHARALVFSSGSQDKPGRVLENLPLDLKPRIALT